MQDPSKPIWFKKVNEENKTVVNLGRPTISPKENKADFQQFLK